ncbi:MAG TPA: acylneuraminate cytidylyltransferase family protein [Thermoanaerobaculia bacterium]|jgi:CMP-N-acetylneuraminic acid synthetase|nr:acylneuraminate cytidylyltransferase family protein [Thermoanaerobaculia bacterium]
MRVLGIVPARGGSKGIPGKNVRPLGGKPLLVHTAEAALAARLLSRVVLTTDDEGIAEVGRGCGLEVPFLRPAELAMDDTPTLPVLQHAVSELERVGDRFDAVCLLQPTSPFRRAGDIDGCIELLEKEGLDAVISVLPVPPEHNPHWVYFRDDGLLRLATGEDQPIPRRQELPLAFHRDGSVYVTRRDVLMEGNSLYGKRLGGFPADSRSVNLDTPADWDRAERLF